MEWVSLRNIHAILSEAENKKADAFIDAHSHGGHPGDISHTFTNTMNGARCILLCCRCGAVEDITDFNSGDERGIIQEKDKRGVLNELSGVRVLFRHAKVFREESTGGTDTIFVRGLERNMYAKITIVPLKPNEVDKL